MQRDVEANLKKGRAFVAGARGLSERQNCRLVLHHPDTGKSLELGAEAVWLSESPPGVGLQLVDAGDDLRERLEAFTRAGGGAPGSESGPQDRDRDPRPDPIRNVHDRVRRLDVAQREALARSGSLPERVALERRFGSSVWEALLRNPQITPSEVCKLARSGSLPTPLVVSIVSNAGWLSDPGIQRALLQNPRVTGAQLDRVLRALPPSELSRLQTQSGGRPQVRTAARRLARR
jgi:hypothetical protein